MNDNRRLSQGMNDSTQISSNELPSMGTTVRAVRHRVENETTTGPTRIDGTVIYSQPNFNGTGNHYQNVRPMGNDVSNTSKQSFSAKRDFFERLKPAPSNYDVPPRQTTSAITPPSSPRQIITTITTTTSPSMEQLLNEATELQKLANAEPKPNKQDSRSPMIVERSEQYQVFLDPTNHEVLRTPSVARVSVVPATKTGHSTDLDQMQMKIDRVADDHQAIHHLTRALQEHNINTVNDFKRLPSQTTPMLVNTTTTTTTTTTSAPAEPMTSSPKNQGDANRFAAIDTVLDHPATPATEKKRSTLQARLSNLVSNIQGSEFKTLFRQSSRQKKNCQDASTETTDPVSNAHLANRGETSLGITAQPFSISTTITEEKKSKKKPKSSSSSTQPTRFNVIDAILATPITQNLPFSLMEKYRWIAPTAPFPITAATNPTYSGLPASPIGQKSGSMVNSPQTPSAPTTPRILYRYIDERGNVLKISSVPPSQLRESVPSSPAVISTSNSSLPHQMIRERPSRLAATAVSADPLVSSRQQYAPTTRPIPIEVARATNPSRTASQPARSDSSPSPYPIQLSLLPHTYQSEEQLRHRPIVGYDTDSTISEPTLASRTYDQRAQSSNRSPHEFSRPIYSPSPPTIHRGMSPDFSPTGGTRNYIEVFRDGDNKPSEIYSLPLHGPSTTSPTVTHRPSRFDQFQNDQQTRSFRQTTNNTTTSPAMLDNQLNRDSPPLTDDYAYSSKSFDYRPLRTKLQRELQVFPTLLVNENDPPTSVAITSKASDFNTSLQNHNKKN